VLTTILASAILFAGAFGFPNETGTEILVRHDLSPAEADTLRTAVCGGSAVPIRFARRQKPRDAEGARDTARDFNQLEGTIFRVLKAGASAAAAAADAPAPAADDACFLAPDALLKDADLLRTTPHVPEFARGTPAVCTVDEQRRFARIRSRAIKRCWTLVDAGTWPIGIVEYERAGRDALASLIVLVATDHGITIDFPAEFNGAGADLWRADDNGNFTAGDISVDFIIRRRDGTCVIPVAWNAAEGVSLQVFEADVAGGRARELFHDYWYRAPR
jgi:hypothetical protein